MLHCGNGAVFAAKGVDSASLGLKVGNRRPEVLILDDLEPDEARYSERLAEKRLGTLIEAILALNIRAYVVLVGTVTMPGSITHQLVKTAQGLHEPELEWVYDEHIICHHHQPLLELEDGTEVSAWPQQWPTAWLQSRRRTREYAKNYLNDPMARDGDYWNADDFTHGTLPVLTHALLSIDPAVTTKEKSDYTALAVVAYSAPAEKCLIRYARAVKIPPGEKLREMVLAILDMYPTITGVLVETNNGGDTFLAILHDLPVKVRPIHSSAPKEVRAADLLAHYQRGRVLHEQPLPALEAQMVSFPKGANDDLVDAAGAGCAVFLSKFLKQPKKAGVRAAAYV
jgi:phage terminase large subunit-like protein